MRQLKRTKVFSLLFIFGISIFLTTGCKKTDNYTRVVTFIVAPTLVEITLYSLSDSDYIRTWNAIKLKDEKTNEVFALFPNSISGFKYSEGYEYTVKVLLSPSYSDPVVGLVYFPSEFNLGTGYSYKLIKILSKTKTSD
jgi:hypothetical protein